MPHTHERQRAWDLDPEPSPGAVLRTIFTVMVLDLLTRGVTTTIPLYGNIYVAMR